MDSTYHDFVVGHLRQLISDMENAVVPRNPALSEAVYSVLGSQFSPEQQHGK